MNYTQEAMCTKCGWHTSATKGNLFLALGSLGACPNCDTKIKNTNIVYPVEGEPFILVDVVYIYRPVWHSPKSWVTLKRKLL